ncbi:DUF4926 domain-containing protein [Thiohalocapsa halophila]|uniref:DUF4926 domain-containing protein n=2 Tax=Thiohalocapsa halophila TaxID=69359 RepID=A0ABS1CQ31_9GAMM|nr:DUF4926 domain-containing protein [Thiohalocapsa halophila]
MRDAADKPIDPFAVVALICDLPDSGLVAGQVGSIVQPVAPDAYEVEFTDDAGQTYTSAAIPANRLLVLHYAPAAQAST